MEKSEIMDKFINELRNNNYKLTDQRRDILKVLIENEKKHFTAESLHRRVLDINPEVGLATIYRNLELFCDLNFIHELDFASDRKFYELLEAKQHHHHMICIECDKIIEFNDEDLEDFEQKLEEEYNFVSVNHFIKFYGYCQECEN